MKKLHQVSLASLLVLFFLVSYAEASFEVKGKGISFTLWVAGKADTEKSSDEIVYLVDLENKIVTRTAVVNADIKNGIAAGLQMDNTVYDIVYDRQMTMLDLMQKDVKKPQRVIKAIGRAGSIDGFETVVIGEDFIITSSSKFDYFGLYYYKRIH